MITSPISKMFVVLAVLAAALITVSFIDHSTSLFAADRSYDGVEQVRVQRPHAYNLFATNYNRLEALRVQRSVKSPAADSSYDMIEQVRLVRWLNVDHSYDAVEALRTQR